MPGTLGETAEAASSKIVELPGRLTTILKAESSAAVRRLELAHALQGLPLPLFTEVPGSMEFSEVCAFFLLSDNGNRAVGVPDHGLRYASHKRPP